MFKKINAQIVFVALAALVLCYPDFIYAQDRAGTLQGVVKDDFRRAGRRRLCENEKRRTAAHLHGG